jgi:uroporphyrinogen-III synthase
VSARILVTRSEPGAGETAARLTARGLAPLVEPLFAIQRLAPALPEFDALAFTSANGVRAFAALSARRDPPVWCVGDRTAAAARSEGFQTVASAAGDVAALQDLLLADLPASGRVLHAGNQEARGDLVGALRAAGRPASFVAVFEAVAVDRPGPWLAAHLSGAHAFDAVLVHSPRAGSLLAGFAAPATGRAPLHVAAISHAASADLLMVPDRLEIAQAPNEDALLAALDRLLQRG